MQVLQNRIVKYMTFINRTSIQVQATFLNYLKFSKFLICTNLIWYKYSADILPSSFHNFFSKLYNTHDHGTRQQVSGNFHHKRVRTDYGKKKLQYVKPVAWGCISNNIKMLPLHTFSNQVKSRMLARY